MTEKHIDEAMRDAGLERITGELSDALDHVKETRKAFEENARELKRLREEVSTSNKLDDDQMRFIKSAADRLADAEAKSQACQNAVESLKRELDAPLYRGGNDLKEKDIENSIELQRRLHLNRFGEAEIENFRPDMDNLINFKAYRSAANKLIKIADLNEKSRVVRGFSKEEQKAFEASGLDAGFFVPQFLGGEIDCNLECDSTIDLYEQLNVNRSTFVVPRVDNYGDLGSYQCDQSCDVVGGPSGPVSLMSGRTYEFRGSFCFNKKTLAEANYDFLPFQIRSANRSHRINRNDALISGDGINQPLGWLNAGCFDEYSTANQNPTVQEIRRFMSTFPVEYGTNITAIMHQNMFGYLASQVDGDGRFLLGDGLLGIGPQDVRDRIRITNCLPDPTSGNSLGTNSAPFAAGSFLMAIGDWSRAYASVTHKPLQIEQFFGATTMFCTQYLFGADDGSAIRCCKSAQILKAGPAA